MTGFAHSKRTNNFEQTIFIPTSVTVRIGCSQTRLANKIKIILLFTMFNHIDKIQEKIF